MVLGFAFIGGVVVGRNLFLLWAHEKFDLHAERGAVEVERFFATTPEEQVGLNEWFGQSGCWLIVD
jgi:hypothetical protein